MWRLWHCCCAGQGAGSCRDCVCHRPGTVTPPGLCIAMNLVGVTEGCWALPGLVMSIGTGRAKGNSACNARACSPSWKSRAGHGHVCGSGHAQASDEKHDPTCGHCQLGPGWNLSVPVPAPAPPPPRAWSLAVPSHSDRRRPRSQDHLRMCRLECDGVSLLANICPYVLGHGRWPRMWKTPPLLPRCPSPHCPQ